MTGNGFVKRGMGVFLLLAAGVLFPPAKGDADRGLNALWDNGTVLGGGAVYPNWQLVHVGSFDFQLWDTGDGPEILVGLTVVNFGTATGADIANVYWYQSGDGATCKGNGTYTMTYAGIYNAFDQVATQHPAWTWSGATTNEMAYCGDPGGGCVLTLDIWADIAACPTEGSTVKMGLPVNRTTNTSWWGSLYDYHADWGWGSAVPWGNVATQLPMDIVYLYKVADKDIAPPGDTVTYTLYYGKPGSGNLNFIEILDTFPAYTHYVSGSAVPPADVGWDPDPGPPPRLKWNFPGPIATAGGATSEITFQVTIDWGNGELIEPGSGDISAPEGIRLNNQAMGYFDGAACSHALTPPVTTVVRRFLFWMIGDNDMLFSSSLGQPPDEMIYSIYIRNMSSTKTWWEVRLWDTVPNEIDVWCPNCGLEDPFLGWTMTPSGAAPANAGSVQSAGKTLLTWMRDMPPGFTIELRWKAAVKPTTSGGSRAVNQISLFAVGRPGIIDGTGSSVVPKRFTHLAAIVLPTTYLSYVAYAAEEPSPSPGFFIDFFPLNKRTQFQLFGIQYDSGQAFVTQGGVSDSIGCQIGDCLGGFPGNAMCTLGMGAIPGGGIAGCKAERVPAVYDPLWGDPSEPYNFVYKLVSNSPLVWQLLTHIDNCNQDRHTFAPSTTITYRGWMHYTWPGDYTSGSSLTLINTGMDINMNHQPNQPTTAHLFTFDYPTLRWAYDRTYELGAEAVTGFLMRGPDTLPATSPDFRPWRIMSSDTALIIEVGSYTFHTAGCCCCSGADNHGAFAPTRETGYTVSTPGAEANFYGSTNDTGCGAGKGLVVVGNVGATHATYDVWVYTPNNVLGDPLIPPRLRNTEGGWSFMGTFDTPDGFADPGNPTIHAPSPFAVGGTAVFRLHLKEGGPVQVNCGTDIFAGWAGGSVIHASSGTTMGFDFWLNAINGRTPAGKSCEWSTNSVDVLVPKAGTVVTGMAEDGYFAQYTTDGPDQCVKFITMTAPADTGDKRNWRFTTSGSEGIALYNQCTQTEKGFTAPFLETGVHYEIIVPPVVYLGQEFWITVIVLAAGNVTKDDYCGTTSFTATDSYTEIESQPMDSYDYTWSADPPSSCDSGGINDNGVKVFVKVTMGTLGLQTIVAADTNDGSIVGLAALMVVAADIKLTKHPRWSVNASGDLINFEVCWSNYSSASGSNFTITDRVPGGFTYVDNTPAADHFCGDTNGILSSATVAYSTTGNNPGDYQTMPGGGVSGVTWLRWTVPEVGVQTTGCVCFPVTVD